MKLDLEIFKTNKRLSSFLCRWILSELKFNTQQQNIVGVGLHCV